jgi:hypothetical protein
MRFDIYPGSPRVIDQSLCKKPGKGQVLRLQKCAEAKTLVYGFGKSVYTIRKNEG